MDSLVGQLIIEYSGHDLVSFGIITGLDPEPEYGSSDIYRCYWFTSSWEESGGYFNTNPGWALRKLVQNAKEVGKNGCLLPLPNRGKM